MTDDAVTKLHHMQLTCAGQLDENNVLTVEVTTQYQVPEGGFVSVYVGKGTWEIKNWHHSTPMRDVLCAMSDALVEVQHTTTL